MLNKSVEKSFKQFRFGFMKVCGGRVLKLFKAHELMAVVIGNEEYDWHVLEENAEYKNGYKSGDRSVCGLLKGYSNEGVIEFNRFNRCRFGGSGRSSTS